MCIITYIVECFSEIITFFGKNITVKAKARYNMSEMISPTHFIVYIKSEWHV